MPKPHAFTDDGSGLTCARCNLPQRHRVHRELDTQPTVEGTMPIGRNHPATSKDMARRAADGFPKVRGAVLTAIAGRDEGATDDEVEQITGRTHQSVSAARNTLLRDALIDRLRDDDGCEVHRRTRSGNPATVWTVTRDGRALADDLNRVHA